MDLVSASFFNSNTVAEVGRRRNRRGRRSEDDQPRQRRRPGRAPGPNLPPPAVQRIPDHMTVNKVPVSQRVRRTRRSRRWGQTVEVGDDIRIQTRNGRRAALVPVREGLWLLGDLDEATLEQMQNPTRVEFGFAPLLAPLLIKAVLKEFAPDVKHALQSPQADGLLKRLLGRSPQDVAELTEIGCGGRRCQCGG